VLLKAAVAPPFVGHCAGLGWVMAPVARLLFSDGMRLGTLPPAPAGANISWLADQGLLLQQTSASDTCPLMFPTDGLASVTDAVFAWLEDRDRLASDPLALTLDVL
jgi:hypothetical protein